MVSDCSDLDDTWNFNFLVHIFDKNTLKALSKLFGPYMDDLKFDCMFGIMFRRI